MWKEKWLWMYLCYPNHNGFRLLNTRTILISLSKETHSRTHQFKSQTMRRTVVSASRTKCCTWIYLLTLFSLHAQQHPSFTSSAPSIIVQPSSRLSSPVGRLCPSVLPASTSLYSRRIIPLQKAHVTATNQVLLQPIRAARQTKPHLSWWCPPQVHCSNKQAIETKRKVNCLKSTLSFSLSLFFSRKKCVKQEIEARKRKKRTEKKLPVWGGRSIHKNKPQSLVTFPWGSSKNRSVSPT